MPGRLRTFCHISEYDELGYQRLHRLIATSDPVVLWGPSSVFLASPDTCRVSSEDFLHFVENGKVQVVAREDWLDDRTFREKHAWEGARWNTRVDGALRRMFRDDQHRPGMRDRRVAAAPDESGDKRAREAIEERPDVVSELVEVLGDERRRGEIPPGTLATAMRAGEDVSDQAEVVLRDAFNHADAIQLTDSPTAFFLGPGVFTEKVAAIHTEETATPAGGEDSEARQTPILTAAELSGQLVELLATLETIASPKDFRSFVMGKGRQELVDWSETVIRQLVRHRPTELKDAFLARLKEEITEGEFPTQPRDQAFVDANSLALSLIAFLEGADTIAVLGAAFAAYPYLKAAAQAVGAANAEFSGSQWPFRYLWNTGSRCGGRHDQLVDLFEAWPSFD